MKRRIDDLRFLHTPFTITLILLLFTNVMICMSLTLTSNLVQYGGRFYINGSAYVPDWNQVDTTPNTFSIASNVDVGPCVCDLTSDICDANCYCDTNCTATEIARFSDRLPEGPYNYTIFRCTDPDLITVNSRGAVTVTVINDLLCISVNNNPTTGEFFKPATSITSGDIDTRIAQYKYKYKVLDTVNLDSTSTSDGFYKVNDRIGAAHVDITGVISPSVALIYQGCVRACKAAASRCSLHFSPASCSLMITQFFCSFVF